MRARFLVLSALIGGLAACGSVTADNPYDPEAPADIQETATVRGEVLSDGAAPLSGATVRLQGDDAPTGAETTDAEGLFEVAGLEPGTYLITIAHPSHIPLPVEVSVRPGEVRELTLQLVSNAAGSAGIAVGGVALKGAELGIEEDAQDHSAIIVEVEGLGIRTVTNAEGRYDLLLQPGTYRLRYSAVDHVPQTTADFDVANDAPVELETVQLETRPGTLTGTVALECIAWREDCESSSNDGIEVSVLGTTAGATTDAAGAFSFNDAPGGVHTVRFHKDGYHDQTVNGVVIRGGATTTVSLPEPLRVRRGSISGSVELAGRSEHNGVAVVLRGAPSSLSAVSDPSGAFALVELPPGSHTVVATYPDYTVVEAVVVLAPGQAQTLLPLVLQPLVGDLELASGAPYTNDRDVDVTRVEAPDGYDEICIFGDVVDAGGAPIGPACPAGGFVAYVDGAPLSVRLSDGDGAKTVRVVFRRDGITESAIFNDGIVLDTVGPVAVASEPAIEVAGGAQLIAAEAVSVRLFATDAGSGVASYRLAETDFGPDCDDSGWVAHALLTDHVFTPVAAGTAHDRTLYVQFRDVAGNCSEPFSDTVTVDKAAPGIGGFVLQCAGSDPGFCASATVEAAVTATDNDPALMVAFSNGPFAGNEVRQPLTPSVAWTLSPGNGPKTVNVRVWDTAGNFANASAGIELDTQPPSGVSLVLVGQDANGDSPTLTRNRALTSVTVTGFDANLTGVEIAEDPQITQNVMELVAGTPSFDYVLAGGGADPTDALITLYARASDAAGNRSTVSSTIRLDTSRPGSPVRVMIDQPDGASGALVNQPVVGVSVGVDASSMFIRLATSPWSLSLPSCPADLSTAERYARSSHLSVPLATSNPTSICVAGEDAAGNIGPGAAVGVQVDTDVPDAPTIAQGAYGTANTECAVLDVAGPPDLHHWEIRLNGQQWLDAGNGATVSFDATTTGPLLADTVNALEVRAVDGATNVGPSSALYLHEQSSVFVPTPGLGTEVKAVCNNGESLVIAGSYEANASDCSAASEVVVPFVGLYDVPNRTLYSLYDLVQIIRPSRYPNFGADWPTAGNYIVDAHCNPDSGDLLVLTQRVSGCTAGGGALMAPELVHWPDPLAQLSVANLPQVRVLPMDAGGTALPRNLQRIEGINWTTDDTNGTWGAEGHPRSRAVVTERLATGNRALWRFYDYGNNASSDSTYSCENLSVAAGNNASVAGLTVDDTICLSGFCPQFPVWLTVVRVGSSLRQLLSETQSPFLSLSVTVSGARLARPSLFTHGISQEPDQMLYVKNDPALGGDRIYRWYGRDATAVDKGPIPAYVPVMFDVATNTFAWLVGDTRVPDTEVGSTFEMSDGTHIRVGPDVDTQAMVWGAGDGALSPGEPFVFFKPRDAPSGGFVIGMRDEASCFGP